MKKSEGRAISIVVLVLGLVVLFPSDVTAANRKGVSKHGDFWHPVRIYGKPRDTEIIRCIQCINSELLYIGTCIKEVLWEQADVISRRSYRAGLQARLIGGVVALKPLLEAFQPLLHSGAYKPLYQRINISDRCTRERVDADSARQIDTLVIEKDTREVERSRTLYKKIIESIRGHDGTSNVEQTVLDMISMNFTRVERQVEAVENDVVEWRTKLGDEAFNDTSERKRCDALMEALKEQLNRSLREFLHNRNYGITWGTVYYPVLVIPKCREYYAKGYHIFGSSSSYPKRKWLLDRIKKMSLIMKEQITCFTTLQKIMREIEEKILLQESTLLQQMSSRAKQLLAVKVADVRYVESCATVILKDWNMVHAQYIGQKGDMFTERNILDMVSVSSLSDSIEKDLALYRACTTLDYLFQRMCTSVDTMKKQIILLQKIPRL